MLIYITRLRCVIDGFLWNLKRKNDFFGPFSIYWFSSNFPHFFRFTPQNKCINSWEHWKCERQTCPLMYKPCLESENLNVFKNRADLAPLPQPYILPNTINLAQNFLCNLDLPPKFILPTLGNTDNLKDIHDNLCLSLIWCRKTSTHTKKYAVLVPLPQPDIQPNTINFVQNFLYNLDLLPKSILLTLGNTDDLKDKHIHLYLSLVWT